VSTKRPTLPADEEADRRAGQAKPTFVLAPGVPTLDELAAMFRKLTGREPDPAT